MVWQQNALGLARLKRCIGICPESYQNGNYTPAKIVDDINAHPG